MPMLNKSINFRFKAFAYHLGISIIIALIGLYLVFIVWHPAPLDKAVGVTHIFIMMLTVDAIVGPLLTLIVANPNKKSIKFDLTIIIAIQLCAYIYGMYNISINRPVYIAFDNKRFEVVQAGDVPKQSLEMASSRYSDLGYGSPKWVAVKPPKNIQEQTKRIFDEAGNGISPSMQPHLYEPIEKQWSIIQKQTHPINELQKFNPSTQVEAILVDYKNANGWLPLKGYNEDMVIIVNTDEKNLLGVVDLRPW